MQPKDQISLGNQAQTLFQEGAIGPKTLLETLNFNDPDDAASDGALWTYSKETDAGRTYIQMNFPQLWQQLQQIVQQQMQEQQAAQQQQMQQEAQQGQQKIEQGAQASQQQLGQKQAAHQQQLQHGDEQHKQKLQQSKEIASAALAAKTKGTQPK